MEIISLGFRYNIKEGEGKISRQLLCVDCKRKIKEADEEYRKDKKIKLKEYRRKYYVEKERGKTTTVRFKNPLSPEQIIKLKRIVEELPDD